VQARLVARTWTARATSRACTAGPPSDRRAWTLLNGRLASVGNGNQMPPPGDSTTAIRVGGPLTTVILADTSVEIQCTDRRGRTTGSARRREVRAA